MTLFSNCLTYIPHISSSDCVYIRVIIDVHAVSVLAIGLFCTPWLYNIAPVACMCMVIQPSEVPNLSIKAKTRSRVTKTWDASTGWDTAGMSRPVPPTKTRDGTVIKIAQTIEKSLSIATVTTSDISAKLTERPGS